MFSNKDYRVLYHHLTQGGIFLSREECLITTILGSCISVCIWDPHSEVGGMNHYVLPIWSGGGLASPRYGDIAIEKLIRRMTDFGCKKNNLRAKVFGGSEILLSTRNGGVSIGTRNITLASYLLEKEGIPVISSDVGGNLGRRLQFNTKTGTVILKRFKVNGRV